MNSRSIRSNIGTSEGTGSSQSDVTISSRVDSIFLSEAGLVLGDLSRQSSGFIFRFSPYLDALSTATKDLRLYVRTFLKGGSFGHHSGFRLLSLQKFHRPRKINKSREHK